MHVEGGEKVTRGSDDGLFPVVTKRKRKLSTPTKTPAELSGKGIRKAKDRARRGVTSSSMHL